jgi:hypothetical protein
MFEALNERLTGVFDRITGRGALSEKDVAEAMREVRVALLEADVALPVVKEFIAFATERATGEEVIRSVKPADQVVKIVYDGLIEMLGGEEPVPLNTNANSARRGADGRPAGLGQDHDLGQAGAAPDQVRSQEGHDGLAGHASSGRDGTAGPWASRSRSPSCPSWRARARSRSRAGRCNPPSFRASTS